MGLGLPLLRLAAEQTGGRLDIESTEGGGHHGKGPFSVQSISTAPRWGDMAGTITLLIQGAPELELTYTHQVGERAFRLDTRQIRAELGEDVSPRSRR